MRGKKKRKKKKKKEPFSTEFLNNDSIKKMRKDFPQYLGFLHC